MQSNDYKVDYVEFHIKAQKEFRAVSEAVNKKDYAMAEKHAMNAMVEMKLMWNSLQILKEQDHKLWRKNG